MTTDPERAVRPVILTVDQAAALLQFEPNTIRRLAARGEIPARKIGGTWRFHQDELEAFVRQGDPTRVPIEPRPTAAMPPRSTGFDSAGAVEKFATRPATSSRRAPANPTTRR